MNVIKINDIVVPAPVRGLLINRIPQIKKMTNATGQIIAQQINRKTIVFQNLEWLYLKREEWETILAELSKVFGTITFFDTETSKYLKLAVMFEDIKEVPYLYDEENKIITYSSCSCTVTDTMQEVTEVEAIV